MITLYLKLLDDISKLRALPPLFFRLILMYGFYTPGFIVGEDGVKHIDFTGPSFQKLRNFDNIIAWFRDDLMLPFPELNAYMATATEVIGIALLTVGLATRLVSIPLMVVMVVAVLTVHLEHGFACSKNGFEIPFYYFFMLFSLFVTGAGKFSLDHLIASKWRRR